MYVDRQCEKKADKRRMKEFGAEDVGLLVGASTCTFMLIELLQLEPGLIEF